jgi:hypothetical protein
MGTYDRSSKFLISRYGDAILRLAGFGPVRWWRAIQSEVVQPGQLPDGLIEALFDGESEPRLFIIEIATYPERRLVEQLTRAALLVYLNRKLLPEVIAIVLHPKGRLRVPRKVEVVSPSGSTSLRLNWQVVEMWNVPAEQLLATGDPGLMPWATLSHTDQTPARLLADCREVIERAGSSEEKQTLLMVAQVLASLRYNKGDVLKVFGGREAMLESPLLDELRQEFSTEGRAQGRAADIIKVLRRRLGEPSPEIEQLINAIRSEERLDDLLNAAVDSSSMAEFERFLRQ